ncbi:hypothetical protein PG994_010336 [Apiospora phragmitis]|uniref:Uncharacterized protein n=1 Tax=Apiospora phragmitis TaxID=2905665 RepID=A0ABR1TRU0_9PEZI
MQFLPSFRACFRAQGLPLYAPPTHLASESGAVGGTQGPASTNTQETPSQCSAYKPEPPMATATSAGSSAAGSGSSPGGTSEADPDETRRLRNQFLNDRFGEPGKKGGRNGRQKPKSSLTPPSS